MYKPTSMVIYDCVLNRNKAFFLWRINKKHCTIRIWPFVTPSYTFCYCMKINKLSTIFCFKKDYLITYVGLRMFLVMSIVGLMSNYRLLKYFLYFLFNFCICIYTHRNTTDSSGVVHYDIKQECYADIHPSCGSSGINLWVLC